MHAYNIPAWWLALWLELRCAARALNCERLTCLARGAAASRQRARQGLATWFSKRFAVAVRRTVFFLSLICLRPTLIQAQVIKVKGS